MDLVMDLKNYDKADTIFRRTAARAVINRGSQYLLIYSKYGDYKFPGGGMNKGETLNEVLIREVWEETGFHVLSETVRFYGKVHERRKGNPDDVLEMDSHYFFCEVADTPGARHLDKYEEEYDYQVVWLSLSEAIARNKQVSSYDMCPWIIRDTKVMETLLLEQYLSEIPKEMRDKVQGRSFMMDSIGCSGARIFMFENGLVLKVEAKRNESDGEYRIMEWLQGKLPVPEIKGFHSDGETNYLLMSRLRGKMACDPDIIEDGKKLVKLLADGLKLLWTVDIRDCPKTTDLDYKLSRALYRVENNIIDTEDAEPNTFGPDGYANPMALYEYLIEHRPEEEYVLAHGDYCLPNVFADNDEVSGFLDLGYCGIADKWQDIALVVRSLKHNLDEAGKPEAFNSLYHLFFEELGFRPDEVKIRYYVLLDELF